MEAYANALLYAIPSFIGLVILETFYKTFVKHIQINHMDLISSISSGVTNVIKDSLGILFIIISYPFVKSYIAIFDMSSYPFWLVFGLAFICLDFASYWNHRLNHKINIFWNRHVIHHSSEQFNLACALRQSISVFIGFYTIFMIPAAILGVPNEVIILASPIHFFLQFWYHTEHIPKLGWLEYILVTPSQHRVHHAINEEYIDKNLSAIFCVWDRVFGTFQEELDDVPPVYGVLKPAQTWNPVLINFQHAARIFRDAWYTKDFMAKLTIWFRPTGWRPDDMKERFPIETIQDVYHFDKYDLKPSVFLIVWSYFQLTMCGILIFSLLYNIGTINQYPDQLYVYSFLIVLGVFGYTTLMDQKLFGRYIEVSRAVLAVGVFMYYGHMFGIDQSVFTMLILMYYILSATVPFFISFEGHDALQNETKVETVVA